MDSKITTTGYIAPKGKVALQLYRKFEGSPVGKPALFLVHGSSLCALPSYDLRVTGRGSEFSMMDQFAEHGFDVWTMDHEGYGRSLSNEGNSDITAGADDLIAAMKILSMEVGKSPINLYGQSAGALRAALFAERQPERVERLLLDAFVWTGRDSLTLARRRERLGEWLVNHRRRIDRESILSIFSRDKVGLIEMSVAEAVAEAQLTYGDTVPAGTYVDMCSRLPVVDPTRITCPVLIIRGEHDGIASKDDVQAFFDRLPTNDKELVVLPDSAHIAHLGINRHLFYKTMLDFLKVP